MLAHDQYVISYITGCVVTDITLHYMSGISVHVIVHR
jgi:hypothetical protein